jgi:hypothetical protein
MEEGKRCIKGSVGKSEEKRSLGRPRPRWEVKVKGILNK